MALPLWGASLRSSSRSPCRREVAAVSAHEPYAAARESAQGVFPTGRSRRAIDSTPNVARSIGSAPSEMKIPNSIVGSLSRPAAAAASGRFSGGSIGRRFDPAARPAPAQGLGARSWARASNSGLFFGGSRGHMENRRRDPDGISHGLIHRLPT